MPLLQKVLPGSFSRKFSGDSRGEEAGGPVNASSFCSERSETSSPSASSSSSSPRQGVLRRVLSTFTNPDTSSSPPQSPRRASSIPAVDKWGNTGWRRFITFSLNYRPPPGGVRSYRRIPRNAEEKRIWNEAGRRLREDPASLHDTSVPSEIRLAMRVQEKGGDFEVMLQLVERASRVAKKEDLAALPPPRNYTSSEGHCEECSICLCVFEDGEQVTDLKCGHSFHTSCVLTWLGKYNKVCPLCKAPVKSGKKCVDEPEEDEDDDDDEEEGEAVPYPVAE